MNRSTTAVLLAGALLLAACGGGEPDVEAGAGTGLECPESVAEPRDPAPPLPVGVNVGDQLVPQEPPARAVICEYARDARQGQGAGALRGEKVLTQGLRELAADLAFLPRRIEGMGKACTLIGAAPETPGYLVGLGYPDGDARVWVSTAEDPNRCTDSVNGPFTSTTYVGDQVRASYEAGRWVPPPPRERGEEEAGPGACDALRTGRLGQETALVPEGVTGATVCFALPPDRAAPDVVMSNELTSGYDELVAAFQALPHRVAGHGCQLSGADQGTFTVLFGYPQGPPVKVTVLPNCDPAITNGHLQAKDASSVIPLLQQLTAR